MYLFVLVKTCLFLGSAENFPQDLFLCVCFIIVVVVVVDCLCLSVGIHIGIMNLINLFAGFVMLF